MESIGERLKKKRQEKKLTLEKVYKETKIHPKVLSALEENKAEEILSPTYAKSFLKLYSQFLGLDSESIIREYTSGIGAPPAEDVSLGASRAELVYRKNWLVSNIIIVVIIALGLIIYLSLRGIFKRPPEKPPTSAKVLKSAPREVKPSTERIDKRKAQPMKSEELNLVLKAKEDTWIQLKTDGKIVFQNILSKGNIESWRAKDKIEMWVGNAGGLQLELNGKKLAPLGRSGQVIKNVLITKDEVKIGK